MKKLRPEGSDLRGIQQRACRKWLLWRAGSDLRAWLFTLMHNLYLNQRRTLAPVQWQDIESVEDRLQAPGDARDTTLDLERCLQQLPAEQRAVLLLVTLEDMDYAEVARVLQVPVGTVMSRLSRARARLKELMDMTPTPPRVPSEMPRVALHRLK